MLNLNNSCIRFKPSFFCLDKQFGNLQFIFYFLLEDISVLTIYKLFNCYFKSISNTFFFQEMFHCCFKTMFWNKISLGFPRKVLLFLMVFSKKVLLFPQKIHIRLPLLFLVYFQFLFQGKSVVSLNPTFRNKISLFWMIGRIGKFSGSKKLLN
jgi:hypothetical protein